ncbi:hypothetical protein T01_6383 [Trichinella spiralis]|uniref:Uncharacterized protein n=1 Tax=Trichinella spiralis TaxID=6334 RepID=A0A0V0YZT9_TRISP|nr:hypothetical protein T01_6383 [Trichinella spiralis]
MRRYSTLSAVRESSGVIERRRHSRVLNYANFRKKYLRECPGHSLKAKENLHIPPEGKYCAIKCFRRSLREYANFYLPWGIA